MAILNESKRDNLLLPCYEKARAAGVEKTFGEFKTAVLTKLGNEAGMHALSLGSNFYLAGAARYYFNGDLTQNKDLSLLKPEGGTDIWNEEVCQRLNALIIILRNIHIDSVGTSLEQPEDFGELPIKKLLRKYGAKINKELGIVTQKKEEEEVLDRNERVSPNYTFDIMFNFNDCRPYERPTAPGAWCITYLSNMLDRYTGASNGHFVIFKQDGYENIPRVKEPEKWIDGRKPQDTYGNSLIAFVQSNTDPGPANYHGAPLITSRWNHGYEEGTRCEADRAYTFEEFKSITGVDDEQLKRIYEIWKKDKVHHKDVKDMAADRALKLSSLRALKYIQMRINGGENPENLVNVRTVINGNGEARKSLLWCTYNAGEEGGSSRINFLMDKGKIIFETIGTEINGFYRFDFLNKNNENSNDSFLRNFVVGKHEKYHTIYNIRFHSLVTVRGVYKFKAIPEGWSRENSVNGSFFEVKQSHTQMALINFANGQPLKLPNGDSWFAKVIYPGDRHYESREINAYMRGADISRVCEIIYDTASREKYFFSFANKQFINIPQIPNDIPWTYRYGDEITITNIPSPEECEPVLEQDMASSNFFAIKYMRKSDASEDRYWGKSTYDIIMGMDGKVITIGNIKYFPNPDIKCDTVLIFRLHPKKPYSVAYDLVTQKPIGFDGTPLVFIDACKSGGWRSQNAAILFFRAEYGHFDGDCRWYYLYDINAHSFIENESNRPNKMQFIVDEYGDENGNGVVYQVSDEARNFSKYNVDNFCRMSTEEQLDTYRQHGFGVITTDNKKYIETNGGPVEAMERLYMSYNPNLAGHREEAPQMAENRVKIDIIDIYRMVNESVNRIIKNGMLGKY